jgi:hypothetical protein
MGSISTKRAERALLRLIWGRGSPPWLICPKLLGRESATKSKRRYIVLFSMVVCSKSKFKHISRKTSPKERLLIAHVNNGDF